MKYLLTLLLAISASLSGGLDLHAQSKTFNARSITEFFPTPNILRNSVTNLHAEGSVLWVGPFLNRTDDNGQTWQVADIDSLLGTRNRVFSVDVEGDVIWVGLGYSSIEENGDVVPSVAGYLVSVDGGESFTYRLPHLDAPTDTLITYGVSTLGALPVIVPQQSPPYDIDYDPFTGDVWIAAWASGTRRSTDQGRTWQRVVLPPDFLDAINPDESYDFEVTPERGTEGNRNHMGFSILVDETGTVWAGTASGINRSTDGGQSWRRFTADGSVGTLTGNWIPSIEEQPAAGRNPVWIASWSAGEPGEQYGITVTRDGGASFEQVLLGERIYDFAFYGEFTVYAAGESGLFVSTDNGVSWHTIRDFYDPTQPDHRVHPFVRVFSVATIGNTVWAGTSDGLFKSSDGGNTWRIYRTEVPLHPDEPTQAVPSVDTYAYPNPFSPSTDRIVRIRYELEGRSNVNIRVFDFGMNFVRELIDESRPEGIREITWDGADIRGLRVANGVYFYAIQTDRDTFWGKIHVLE